MLQVWEPFKHHVQQGSEPPKLARSFSVGFLLGLCPLLGRQASDIVFCQQAQAGLLCWAAERHVCSAGVSFGACLAVIFLSMGTLHAPMTLLANGLSVPFEVRSATIVEQLLHDS